MRHWRNVSPDYLNAETETDDTTISRPTVDESEAARLPFLSHVCQEQRKTGTCIFFYLFHRRKPGLWLSFGEASPIFDAHHLTSPVRQVVATMAGLRLTGLEQLRHVSSRQIQGASTNGRIKPKSTEREQRARWDSLR